MYAAVAAAGRCCIAVSLYYGAQRAHLLRVSLERLDVVLAQRALALFVLMPVLVAHGGHLVDEALQRRLAIGLLVLHRAGTLLALVGSVDNPSCALPLPVASPLLSFENSNKAERKRIILFLSALLEFSNLPRFRASTLKIGLYRN